MKNRIVTISREYASGGRDVGRALADELGLPVFDKEIMHIATEKSGLPDDFVEKHGEHISSKFFQNLMRLSLNVPSVRVPMGYTSLTAAKSIAMSRSPDAKGDADHLFYVQADAIREVAAAGGCVIVGRCAGYILRDNPNLLSVFIRGNFEDRVQRAIQTYNCSEKTAAADVQKIDKHRANYYNFYTRRKWGVADNYDLVVNTSYAGISGAVAVIKAMLDAGESAC